MAFPTGLTAANALARVRAKTNQATVPPDATVYSFLNDALEQVNRELQVVFTLQTVAVASGAATFTLPADVQDFMAITFSTAPPTSPGVIEYEMVELQPLEFVDATWNAPTMSGGPTVLYRRIADGTGTIQIQLYPLAPASGYINVYYYQRPQLWDPTNPASTTNMDSAYQFGVILLACVWTAEARENLKKAGYFQGLYEAWLAKSLDAIGKRRRKRRAQVRDVTSSPSVVPAWFPGG